MYTKVLNFTAKRFYPVPSCSTLEGLRSTAMWFQALLMEAAFRKLRPQIHAAQASPSALAGAVSVRSELFTVATAAHLGLWYLLTPQAARDLGIEPLGGVHGLNEATAVDVLELLASREVFYEVAQYSEVKPDAIAPSMRLLEQQLGNGLGRLLTGYTRPISIVGELHSVAAGRTAHLSDWTSFRSFLLRTEDEVPHVRAKYASSPAAQGMLDLRATLAAEWRQNDGSILFQT